VSEFDDRFEMVLVTAVEARAYAAEVEAERALAVRAGVAEIDSYMHDLAYELDVWRHHYVTAAVTEIATLRAELSGRQVG
jgi:hypothetical protein